MRPRLVVFDLDGTLVDSRRDIADAANALLASCGAPPLAEDRIGRMVGDGAANLVARAFEAAAIERPPDALDRFLALYERRLIVHTRPYPGMIDVLEALAERGPLAVLTNKPLRSKRAILQGLDLARFFAEDAVVGGDGAFPRKPDPAGLKHIQTRAAVPATASVLVGDSLIDFRTARAGGTDICLARYGFGFEGFPVELLRSDDIVIDSPADLLRL